MKRLNSIIELGSEVESLEARVAKANILIRIGKYDQSFSILDDIEKKNTLSEGNSDVLARAYGFKGNIYLKIGNGPKAVTQFLKSLSIFKKINIPKGVATSYSSIALGFEMAKNKEKAKEYYTKAIDILNAEENSEIILLLTYLNVKKIDTSPVFKKEFYSKINYLIDKIDAPKWKGVAILHSSEFFIEKKKYEVAATIIENAINILLKAKYYPGVVGGYIMLSGVYLNMKKYEEALQEVQNGLNYSSKAQEITKEIELHNYCSIIYEQLNKPIMALRAWKKMATLKIEMFERNKAHLVTEIEAQYKIGELETAKKMANLELKKSEELNKELEQFAYMTSHDLKAPLRNISTFSNFLLTKENTPEKSKEVLEQIEGNAIKMSKLIDSLLEYAKLGFKNIPLTSTPLDFVMKNAIDSMEQIIVETNTEISYNSLPNIYGNYTILVQLFQNLISNSIKYNKSKPKIEIVAKNLENGFILISFSDNGIGIPRKHINNVFAAFNRAHANDYYNGSGIGLAICKKIIQAHKGEIWVESEEQLGTTFYIKFKEGN